MFQAVSVKLHSWTISYVEVRPYWLTLILGALASLAMPPVHAWILLPIAFSGFLIILERTTRFKSAFLLGWVFGFGYFTGGLYWLGNGPLMIGMWVAVPFATVGLPICLAFFPAVVSLLTFRFAKTSLSRVFIFAVLWSIAEWLRGHIFTGFPWNLLGYTWDVSLLQITSVIGIYGLTAVTTLAACIFASRHKVWVIGIIVSLLGMWVWGDYRLTQSLLMQQGDDKAVNLRIVQASIPQHTKWLVEHFQENLDRYIALSQLPAEKPLAAIIWPESSVTTLVENFPPLMKRLSEASPPGGILIFGAPRLTGKNLRTSMMVLNNDSQIVGTYDKSHLVPFGEYMPFRSILTIKKLTYGDQDYTPGNGVQTLSLPGVPNVSPLICYEAIFPGKVVNKNHRSDWMLNLTNDAWYGHSSGPYQHLQIVRVRAIEEGIPLVRSANNGISAVIDAWGRILYRLELDEIGFIDFSLPKPLNYVTVYQRWGDLPFVGILVTLFILAVAYRQKEIIKIS